MKYYIKRELNEYGPYTLADLQRYVASGNIALTDLTRSEGMTDWIPVSQVIGNIPVPVPAQAPAGTYAGGPYADMSAYGVAMAPAVGAGPIPPDLHWALVLLIEIVTCTLFSPIWFIVEAVYIRKIKPQSKGLLLVCLGIGLALLGGFVNGVIAFENRGHNPPYGSLFSLASWVLQIVAAFTLRSDLEDYYTTTENINLRLDGVGSALLTLFFPVLYFQYHFSRIAKWKKTGALEPQ